MDDSKGGAGKIQIKPRTFGNARTKESAQKTMQGTLQRQTDTQLLKDLLAVNGF